MPAAVADQVKVVFVTTDPARDSPSVLRSWLDRFDAHFIGLTGSEAAIEAARRAARIPLARKTARPADGIIVSGATPEDWVHDLPNLVAEGWSSR